MLGFDSNYYLALVTMNHGASAVNITTINGVRVWFNVVNSSCINGLVTDIIHSSPSILPGYLINIEPKISSTYLSISNRWCRRSLSELLISQVRRLISMESEQHSTLRLLRPRLGSHNSNKISQSTSHKKFFNETFSKICSCLRQSKTTGAQTTVRGGVASRTSAQVRSFLLWVGLVICLVW